MKALELIPSYFTSEARNEVEHYLDLWEDSEDYDSELDPETVIYDALSQAYDLIEDVPRLAKQFRRAFIDLEVYKVITDEELSVMVSSGKKYTFIQDGQKYVFDNHPSYYMAWLEWIDC